MEWNWQKIEVADVKQLNLPEFNKTVLLADKRENKTYVAVGSLEILNAKGAHWSTGNDVFSEIFGGLRDMKYKEHFKPTHWCEIKLP